jgi:histidinol-phosphatase
MKETTTNLMHAVEEVARLAGEIALAGFRDRPATETKPDGTPVTASDRAAERAAREWIVPRFPGDSVVGEELGIIVGTGRQWVIDPIDGTKSFVRGVPLWGTLVAVCEDTKVIASAVFCPAVGQMMVAGMGEGCWLDGVRASVSEVGALAEATVLTSDTHFQRLPSQFVGWRMLVGQAAVARTWGDCYGYLMVASGRAEVMCDPILSDWDSAAVQRCIVEAGGVFTDWRGHATAFGGSAIATNAKLAETVRGILR